MGEDNVMRAIIASKKAKRGRGFKTSAYDKRDMSRAKAMVADFVAWMQEQNKSSGAA